MQTSNNNNFYKIKNNTKNKELEKTQALVKFDK
jgi:hypothetical protein